MESFEEWQKRFEEAEALAFTTTLAGVEAGNATSTETVAKELSPEDQAVHDLCLTFSEAELLTPTADQELANRIDTRELNAPQLAFKRSLEVKESVTETYEQLVSIADELREELLLRNWTSSTDFLDEHMEHLRVAFTSGKLAGFASSLVRDLLRFKQGLELSAGMSIKIVRPQHGVVADVSELFLLTALSADQLRLSLDAVYDC